MSYIQQFFTSRDNNANAETFVGQEGRLWWDPVTNQIYSSDGNTPGGIPLSGGGGGNGTPGGSNSQVQFNDSGTFGGVSTLTFNKNTGELAAGLISVTGNVTSGNFVTTGTLTSGSVIYTNVDGLADQVLATYGNGVTYFKTVSSGVSSGYLRVYIRSGGYLNITTYLGYVGVVSREGIVAVPITP
jgi:hypothetical protein